MLERLASVNYIALDKVNSKFIDYYLSFSPPPTKSETHICCHVYVYVIGSGYIDSIVDKNQSYTSQ